MTNLDRPEIEPMLEPAPKVLTTKDIVIGDGAEAPANSVVNVHYLGVDYESGEEFDSSWGRGESIEFPLNRLIKGWQEGIPLFKKGGKGILLIPSELGYGNVSQGAIPENSVLIFDIELIDVK